MGAWKYQIYSISHVEHLNMTFSDIYNILIFISYSYIIRLEEIWIGQKKLLTNYLLILVNALLSSIGVHSSWFHA